MICPKCGIELQFQQQHQSIRDCVLQIWSSINLIHVAEFFPVPGAPVPKDVLAENNDIIEAQSGAPTTSAGYYLFCFRKRVQRWYNYPETAILYAEESSSSFELATIFALRSIDRYPLSIEPRMLGVIAPTADPLWKAVLQDREGIPSYASYKQLTDIPYPAYTPIERGPNVGSVDVQRRPIAHLNGVKLNYYEILLNCLRRAIDNLDPRDRMHICNTSRFYPAAVLSLKKVVDREMDAHATHITGVACTVFIAYWNLFATSIKLDGLIMLRRPSFGYATPTTIPGDAYGYEIRFGVGVFDPAQTHLIVHCVSNAIRAAVKAAQFVVYFIHKIKVQSPTDAHFNHFIKYLAWDIGSGTDWNKIILESYLCASSNLRAGIGLTWEKLHENLEMLYDTHLKRRGKRFHHFLGHKNYSGKGGKGDSFFLASTNELVATCCACLSWKNPHWKQNLPQHPMIPQIYSEYELSFIFRRAKYECTIQGKPIFIKPHAYYREACHRLLRDTNISETLFGCYMNVEYRLGAVFYKYLQENLPYRSPNEKDQPSKVPSNSHNFQYDSDSDIEDSGEFGYHGYYGSKRMFLFGRTALDFILGFIRAHCGVKTIYKLGPGTYFEFETFRTPLVSQNFITNSAFVITPNAYPKVDNQKSGFKDLLDMIPKNARILLIDSTIMGQNPKRLMILLSNVLQTHPSIQTIMTFSSEHKIGMWGFDRFPLADARLLTRDASIAKAWKFSLRGREDEDPIALLSRMWRNFLSSRGLRYHLLGTR